MSTDTNFASGPLLRHGWTNGDDGWDTEMEINLRKLNMLLQVSVKSILNAAPGSPTNGDMYVVGTAGSGAFSGHSKAVAAFYDSTWYFIAPYEGMTVYNQADESHYTYSHAGAWATPAAELAEAPIDGNYYARKDAAWAVAPGGMTDAPSDGTPYGRQDAGWVSVGSTPTESIIVALGDETTALVAATGVVKIRMPYAFTLTEIRASLVDSSSSGAVEIDVKESGGSVFSTTLTIDSGEKTSTTAATPAVISDTALADDAEISFDIVSEGTSAAGLKVMLIGHQ